MPLQKIKFQTNITVEAALKFAEGKLCDSQFGDPQYMFTTVDDHVFFVAEKAAQKIHGLRLQPQAPFEICKKEVDYGNGLSIVGVNHRFFGAVRAPKLGIYFTSVPYGISVLTRPS